MFSKLFSAIGHFFSSLFGKNADLAQKVIHDAASFANLAEPIVEEITVVVGAASAIAPNAAFTKLSGDLATVVKDEAKVQSFLTAATGYTSTADLLHAAAVFILGQFVPAGTAASLINLAVELAYNISKQKAAVAPAVLVPAAA